MLSHNRNRGTRNAMALLTMLCRVTLLENAREHILGKVSEISNSIFCFQNKCQIKITTYTKMQFCNSRSDKELSPECLPAPGSGGSCHHGDLHFTPLPPRSGEAGKGRRTLTLIHRAGSHSVRSAWRDLCTPATQTTVSSHPGALLT